MFSPKTIILLTVFIDVLGIGIVIPILPFYVSTFSNSPLLITSLFTVFSLCAFFSAPIIGALSDRVGRRPMLIASIFSTALGWFVFAAAPSVLFLFIGRILDGIMAGNFPIAQSYLTDIAKTDKERTANLGLIGAVFGIGFILGPFLGGLLGQFGHTVPFWCVGALALFNAILAIFILPETHTKRSKAPLSINPFRPLIKAASDHTIRSNYLAWFLFGLAIAGFQAIFALNLRDAFRFDELVGGAIFGLVGVMVALNQGLAMKHFWLKYFQEPVLELGMLVIFAVGMVLLSSTSLLVFCVALVLTTFGQSVLRVVMTSQVIGLSDPSRWGEILGIMSSITSLSMTLSPFLAGIMYEKIRALPFWISALYLSIAFVVLYQKRRFLAQAKLPEDVAIDSMI